MDVLVIACSLNPDSRSARLAEQAAASVRTLGASASVVDLREYALPACDGAAAYGDERVTKLADRIRRSDAVLLAAPIYNYSINAAAKNLIELTGEAWAGAVVGFLCAAGGKGSYMSVMTLANSLMLDFRCVIVPRFVYATGGDFDLSGEDAAAGGLRSGVVERIAELCADTVRIGGALSGHPARASQGLGET